MTKQISLNTLWNSAISTALPAIMQYSFSPCPSHLIAFSFKDVPHSCRKCCQDRVFHSDEFAHLPEAARQYLEHAIAPGTAIASAVRLQMHGELNLA